MHDEGADGRSEHAGASEPEASPGQGTILMSHSSNALSVRPIEDCLDPPRIEELRQELARRGASALPNNDGGDVDELFGDVDDDALDDVLERLAGEGIGAHIFLPVEFLGVIDIRGAKCASTFALLGALKAIRPELGLDEAKSDRPPGLSRQRSLWKRLHRGACLAEERGLVLELVRF